MEVPGEEQCWGSISLYSVLVHKNGGITVAARGQGLYRGE